MRADRNTSAPTAQPGRADIEASARTHGVSDTDTLHALRHHWRGFETDDPDVTMFIGPAANGEPLEVGVIDDAEASRSSTRCPPDPSSCKVGDPMTTRAQRVDALERWADDVDADDLVEANTAALRTITELVEQRDDGDAALLGAIRDARNADRSWSEIGAMLGVSKQAAQRKYADKISA